MLNDTRIKKKVDTEDFIKLIQQYTSEQIECTDHTFFRLSKKQREIFTCNELKEILKKERPFLAGIQYNGNCSTFYKHQNKTIKIILNITDRKVNIVTFYFIEEWQIPRI